MRTRPQGVLDRPAGLYDLHRLFRVQAQQVMDCPRRHVVAGDRHVSKLKPGRRRQVRQLRVGLDRQPNLNMIRLPAGSRHV